VAETIGEVLAEQPDDILRDLMVVEVQPAPDESRLLVTVAPGPGARLPGPLAVIQHLDESTGLIRAEVAAAITRRRAPQLEFRYALPARTG
jgi:ribosome-binding factor A